MSGESHPDTRPNGGAPPAHGSSLLRIRTGNRQLDEILGGGFPANSINVVMGEPGSGKTVLAQTIAFANADGDGRPILYLTTLSEPLEKIVRYVQQFEFYDEGRIGRSIFYESIGAELTQNGVDALVPRLKTEIKKLQPKLIIIDSFKAVHDLAPEAAQMRRMLYELAGLVTAFATTTFLVGEYATAEMQVFPEFAVADGIVELARSKLGTRDERYVRVLKLRGSGYLEGLHAFRIAKSGLAVYPRLVGPHAAPDYEMSNEQVPTGITGLDGMLAGGLRRGRSTFVLGSTGAGKTTLGLQFVLEGVRRGEPCIYVNFEENPTQLASQIASLGGDVASLTFRGLRLLYRSPVELQIDSIVSELFATIHDNGIRRVVLDSVGDLIDASTDETRLHGYLYALLQHFAVDGVTSLFTYEAPDVGLPSAIRVSTLADNILLLGIDLGKEVRRTIRIVKARATAHDLQARELKISSKGVQVS
jgi:circadian clock protein KaiC